VFDIAVKVGSRGFNVLFISPCLYGVKTFFHFTVLVGCIIYGMDDELVRKVRSEFARQGGLARAKSLTAKQRRESATKASKAAAKARTRKAKERKARKRESA
jgi:hypothetical protein